MSDINNFVNDLWRQYQENHIDRFEKIFGVKYEELRGDPDRLRQFLASDDPTLRGNAVGFLAEMDPATLPTEEMLRKYATDDPDRDVRAAAVAILGKKQGMTEWKRQFDSAETRRLLLGIMRNEQETDLVRRHAYISFVDWDKFCEIMETYKTSAIPFEAIDWVYVNSRNE